MQLKPDQNDVLVAEANVRQQEVRYEHSSNFASVLEQLQMSLLVSTYQAGKLLVIGSHAGQLTFAFHSFDQVMGVAVSPTQLAVGMRRQVCFLNAAHEFAPQIAPVSTHDQCWLARTSFTTGSIHVHDLAWGTEGLWVVNTLFSSLCTLSSQYNFVPRWRPPFISKLIDQDRCHLNGLAMESGEPRYVTVLGETDEPAGWRANKVSGGAIVDVPSGRTIARGLCMPHSPRIFGSQLYFCNSGLGNISKVDRLTGNIEPIAKLPGYTRGLAIHGGYAFVGLSKIRETNIFGGLPIGEYSDELLCGVGVIELATGRTIATLQFHSGVEEIFAVEAIPGARSPKLCGPVLTESTESEIWVVPSQSASSPLESQLEPPFGLTASEPADQQPPVDQQTVTQEGVRAHGRGDFQEALRCYRLAIQSGPPTAQLLINLGNLHQDLEDSAAAMACYLQAVQLDPLSSPAHQNLGVLYSTQNQPHRALHHFELAQQASPHPINFVLGAQILPIIYDSVDQVQYWRERLSGRIRDLAESGFQIDTTSSTIPTSFFFAYQGENDRPLMEGLSKVYRGVKCCASAKESDYKPKGKRIRVGFVSSYFCNHTIGRLNLGVIERLSRDDFEVTVVSLRSHGDDYSTRYRKAADNFVQVPRDTAEARKAIAALELDILIFTDVGMDSLTQTLCYSRMAPIQAVTWGHPDTTGSPAIDYFISSDLAEPEDAESHYSEQLVRLPTMGVYYPATELAGKPRDKASFGLDPARRVYLCPQTLFKFHPEYDKVLSGILEQDPQGDLVVISSSNPHWNASLISRWNRTIPGGECRVRFLPSQPRNEFLHLLNVADVMLDPFPFCGGNTTYEAIAVGTPVVTLPGKHLRGRLTHALYRRMNMLQLVASSEENYVELAVQTACDERFGNEVRKAIADTRSVLYENPMDVVAYERMLQSWCDP